ncbi:MAG: hypothetical protein ACI4XH_01840 [Acutalibacteraceae bacterium]
MKIEVYNSCSCPVKLCISSKNEVVIQPKDTVFIENENCDNLSISAENADGSSRKNGIYNICIKTTYGFKSTDEIQRLTVTREKAQVYPDVWYDKTMILSPFCGIESYEAADKSKVKKLYRRNKVLHIFLLNELAFFGEFILVLIIFGIILAYNFGIKILAVYCLCAYLFLVLASAVSELVSDLFVEKGLRFPGDKNVIRQYIDAGYISDCYSSSNPDKIFMKIKRDD